MTTQLPFPQHLHWSAQDIADAVPLRLFEIFAFEADSNLACGAGNVTRVASPRSDWRRRDYVCIADLPAHIRIR